MDDNLDTTYTYSTDQAQIQAPATITVLKVESWPLWLVLGHPKNIFGIILYTKYITQNYPTSILWCVQSSCTYIPIS